MADRFTSYRQIGNAHLRVTGLAELLEKFAGLAEDGIPRAAVPVLTEFGRKWWERSQNHVHVITGRLKASCTGVDVIPHWASAQVEVSLEYDTPYAAIEHHRDGAHAWLQLSWNESEADFEAAVGEVLTRSLESIF